MRTAKHGIKIWWADVWVRMWHRGAQFWNHLEQRSALLDARMERVV